MTINPCCFQWLLKCRPAGAVTARFFKAASTLIVLVAVLTGPVLLTNCSPDLNGPSSVPPATAKNVTLPADQRKSIHLLTVELSAFRKTVETTGTVDFDNEQTTTVVAPIGGPVSRLLVSLGQHVTADEPLASVDSPDFAAALGTYRKAIATAKSARQVADMDKDLIEHRAIAQRDADQAELTAVTAEADREAALQALISLKADPQTLKAIQDGQPYVSVQGMIRSPVAGTVVEKLITPGQLLQAGATPCFTVSDLSRVWVMAHLFSSDLTSVSLDDTAEILTGIDAKTFAGKVDNVSALVDPDTRSVAVRVVANNPDDFLKKGMYVRVRIEDRRESTGLLVPVSAILRDDQNLPFVYLAQTDGSFARRPVTLGSRVGDRYDITAGLAKGDQVIIDGGLFVQFLENQ